MEKGKKSKFGQKIMSLVWDMLTAINGLVSGRKRLRAGVWGWGERALEKVRHHLV